MAENYVLLETIELTSSASSVTFDNIPQSGYTDLKIVASARATGTGTAKSMLLSFNGSTSSFSSRFLEGSGSGAASYTSPAQFIGNFTGGGATASTFGNLEIYIPNYTSSNYKSASGDSVTENNATTAYADLTASLWSNTAAITSVTLTPEAGVSLDTYSTFSLYGVAATGTTPAVAPKATGGNMVSTDGTYWYHTFLTSGTFTPQTSLTCDYLVVAGGGSGNYSTGNGGTGGGGAGGLRSTVTATGGGGTLESPLALTSSINYTVAIGAGGASVPGTTLYPGSNSVFATITATGGGGGANGQGVQAGNGGSGGGAGENSSGLYGTGTTNQGYRGGGTIYTGSDGHGGGGAGAIGGNGVGTSQAGNGGVGVAVAITGTSTYYAGGGGGSSYQGVGGNGGTGGGGNGTGPSNRSIATAGTANTGGGGGALGGSRGYTGNTAGGSGIVIIRYAI